MTGQMQLWMANGLLNLVSIISIFYLRPNANIRVEHTLLVTETSVEVLTAANEKSPGGPVPMPMTAEANGVSK